MKRFEYKYIIIYICILDFNYEVLIEFLYVYIYVLYKLMNDESYEYILFFLF